MKKYNWLLWITFQESRYTKTGTFRDSEIQKCRPSFSSFLYLKTDRKVCKRHLSYGSPLLLWFTNQTQNKTNKSSPVRTINITSSIPWLQHVSLSFRTSYLVLSLTTSFWEIRLTLPLFHFCLKLTFPTVEKTLLPLFLLSSMTNHT